MATVDGGELLELLRTSLERARSAPDLVGTPMQVHRARSRAWIAALADSFKQKYRHPNFCVFTQGDASHRAEFGRNELLYDVLVVDIGTVQSAVHKKQLSFVRDVLWQVESEFAHDSRQALFDFNKLVLGSAHYKLFIGPNVSNPAAFLQALLPAAQSCTGSVYAALVPHPARWHEPNLQVNAWQLGDGQWNPCSR
jgi:hypothetical protein